MDNTILRIYGILIKDVGTYLPMNQTIDKLICLRNSITDNSTMIVDTTISILSLAKEDGCEYLTNKLFCHVIKTCKYLMSMPNNSKIK